MLRIEGLGFADSPSQTLGVLSRGEESPSRGGSSTIMLARASADVKLGDVTSHGRPSTRWGY